MFFKNKYHKKNRAGMIHFRTILPAMILAVTAALSGGLYSISQADSLFSLFSDKYINESIIFSLQTAFASTLISAVSGTAAALLIWSLYREKKAAAVIYIIPLIVPHILAAFFVQVFFSQGGLLSSLFFKIGAIDSASEFPLIVFDQAGIGIILGYFYKESAFITIVVLASLRKLAPEQLKSALMLSKNRTAAFRKIIFPHIASSLENGMLIIFIYSFGAFDIPFIAGSSTRPMAAVQAYTLFFKGSFEERAEASSMIFLIWLISISCLLIYFLIRKPVKKIIAGG